MQVRVCLLVGAVLVMAACGSSSAPATTPTPTVTSTGTTLPTLVTVAIPLSTAEYDANKPTPTAFTPAGIEVATGGTVTWRNNDIVAHVTAGPTNTWNAPLSTGGTFSRTFPTAGTFDYKCTIHPDMTGTITVK